MSEKSVKRVFIGNLSPQLLETPEDLVNRLSKFGEIKSELETHFKEVRNSSFAYIDIELDDAQYAKLKGSLNGVNYKGNKLVIDLAKQTYKVEWQRHHDDTTLEKKKRDYLLKQQWESFKKVQNVKKTFIDRQLVIKGRMRKIPRKDIKKMTFRLILNDTVKIINQKTHKTKLWGYEKNKQLRDLAYKFQNGVWKDGNDHIVERLNAIELRQGGNTLRIERVNETVNKASSEATAVDEEEVEELDKNNKVLADILGNFDFEKEIDYKEDLDEFGHSDYEYEGMVNNSDDDDDDDNTTSKKSRKVDVSQIEYVKEGEFNKASSSRSLFDESDDDDFNDDIYDKANMGFAKPQSSKEEIEVSTKVDTKENSQLAAEDDDEENYKEDDEEDDDEKMDVDSSDEDTEFLPSFGQGSTMATSTTAQPETSNLVSGTVSNTETLRGLFNSNEKASFKLIEEEDEDIDKTKQVVQEDIKLPEFTVNPIVSKVKNKKSLFFPHFESPFLVAQTQINAINSNVDHGNWGEEFWEKRSEWTQDLKRRRRDVLRQMRKKNAKNSRVFV